jgi:hypothetical protein
MQRWHRVLRLLETHPRQKQARSELPGISAMPVIARTARDYATLRNSPPAEVGCRIRRTRTERHELQERLERLRPRQTDRVGSPRREGLQSNSEAFPICKAGRENVRVYGALRNGNCCFGRRRAPNAASRASDSVSREWSQDRTPLLQAATFILVIGNSQCRALGVAQF